MGIEDMQIYVVNLGKYTEGEETGAWFDVPVNMDELKEVLGLNEEYEEYAIHDYSLPFEISEHEPIEEINRRCRLMENVPENMLGDLREIQRMMFDSFDEMMENIENITVYENVEDMSDIARNFVLWGLYGTVPEKLRDYIDYERLGNDIKIEGDFVIGSNNIYSFAP